MTDKTEKRENWSPMRSLGDRKTWKIGKLVTNKGLWWPKNMKKWEIGHQ
ncbi:hypothetical protein [Neobacillus massiliamazoniensis]|nr:hypothetical protein [Neobacillus massiliamazoniensis]